ncbi:cytochrome P450 [Paraphoma chrysanthemicola]|uniref:Cytochrome P450 n=1 Tax=Paraphoma chrysanthemicola TaxID=798071 RepID=A0A8K0R863_9PLEO|nr:cytochrome P450 [Paraphoma chrysanthemicola]
MHVFTVFSWSFCMAIAGVKVWLMLPLLWKWNFPLWAIPGPKLAAWTRLWWIKQLYSGKSAETLALLARRHGPLVRIAPNTVLISDPDTIRLVLAPNSGYLRGPWFDSLRLCPHKTNVVSERDAKKHQHLRLLLAAGTSGKDVPSMEHIIHIHVGNWLQMLNVKSQTLYHGDLTIDLSRDLPFLSMDIITHLCLGESFGDVQFDTDRYSLLEELSSGMVAQQYIASLLEVKRCLFWLGGLPIFRTKLFPSAKQPTGLGQVMRIIQQKVEQKLAKKEQQTSMTDMLDSFLARGLDPEQAGTELLVVLFSAVGATSYTMQGIIRGIISNPAVYQTLQHEIDVIIEEQGTPLSDCTPEIILKNMPYLQACISEGLRLYPAITQLRERVVPSPGDNLHGHYIPGGTYVALNGLCSQSDSIYGSEPEKFRPERWLLDDKKLLALMRRNLDLNFGYGSSKCLGINLAHLELSKVVFELLRRYNVGLANARRPWVSRGDFVLRDFKVRLSRRPPQVKHEIAGDAEA